MNFTLIICTYQRPKALLTLLNSVKKQSLYPYEILIIDGSTNNETQIILEKNSFINLKYIQVSENERGLTKQRNVGIRNVDSSSEIVCFLDDDTILDENYFEELIKIYDIHPEAVGVGGYISNEIVWEKVQESDGNSKNHFYYDGFRRTEALRFRLRKKLGLIDETPPGFMPKFSHGRSISYLPPSGKTYPVEFFMGGVASYKKVLFKNICFSTYFEGYGLYEDLDFCLRASAIGKLYVNTKAQLGHYHDSSGRPNKYKYGKMVVRNGWYVWRVKFPNPTLKSRLLFHSNIIVLLKLRFINSITGSNKNEAFTEAVGRLTGWFSLLFNKPK